MSQKLEKHLAPNRQTEISISRAPVGAKNHLKNHYWVIYDNKETVGTSFLYLLKELKNHFNLTKLYGQSLLVQTPIKVPLVEMSQDDPLYPSSKKKYQVDSDNNNMGEYNMIKEKVINNP